MLTEDPLPIARGCAIFRALPGRGSFVHAGKWAIAAMVKVSRLGSAGLVVVTKCEAGIY
jgi:hypothetical protein